MSDSVWPHRRQPTRLPHPWDSPGKNTGVGCHFLLQCIKVKSESEVAQSCLTLSDPMDCSLPGSSIHRIFQAGVLEWGAIAFSEISPYTCQNSCSQKVTNSKCWQGCGEKRTLMHCCWECKLVLSLCKTVWRCLKKLEIELLHPAILLLSIYLKRAKSLIQKGTGTLAFIAALFTIANVQKKPQCLSTYECMKKIHVYNGLSLIHKKNEILPFVSS